MELQALIEGVRAGDRRALARGITLVESTRPDHRQKAEALLSALMPIPDRALRIGLTGTPGVGKSTFIEGFGRFLTAKGLRIAVLAVDPSSARTGGSILGDKTRMDRLARDPLAYIRPSPSGATLGGVGRRTREAILLCEAAGFDVILVETVGVGQSETMVAQMTDVFALLLAPAGGDELQGVKRGVMEMADLVVVNKADGELLPVARRTQADYAGALRLLRKREGDPEGIPTALAVSALAETGFAEVWAQITRLDAWRRAEGWHGRRRAEQAVRALHHEIESGLMTAFKERADIAAALPMIEDAVRNAAELPEVAAVRLLRLFTGSTLDAGAGPQ